MQGIKGQRYRLQGLVAELQAATSTDYQTALLAFINCLIISTPQLQDRVRMRNEFIGQLHTLGFWRNHVTTWEYAL